MKKRIFRLSSVLIIVCVLATAILLSVVLYFDFSSKLKSEIKFETEVIAEVLNNNGENYINEIPITGADRRLTLISQSGKVLFDNLATADELENHLERPEIADAMSGGFGESTRKSETFGRQFWYYAIRLENNNIIRLSRSASSLFSYMLSFLPIMLLILAAVLLLALFFTSKMTRRIVEPINAIDIKNPSTEIYEELSPLISTIKKQNLTIDDQIYALKEQQREFSAITDHMQEGFIIIDSFKNVLSYNQSSLELLGHTPDSEFENVLEFNRDESFRLAVDTALAGKPCEKTTELDGRYLHISANPVRLSGRTEGAVLTIFDITERHDHERIRREFTANVSHELKTPLTSISGYAEIIENGIAKPEDVAGFAGKIYSEAQRLISLVNDIMKLSKLDEGTADIKEENVKLDELCRNVLSRLAPLAEKKSVTILCNIEPVEINGIGTILDEMVYNLCENAIKYNIAGGKVELALENLNDEMKLTIKDTGCGIDLDERERIFERFYRIDKSRETTEGTGLGLSIVKHGAIVHNALIEIESTASKGTCISLHFKK